MPTRQFIGSFILKELINDIYEAEISSDCVFDTIINVFFYVIILSKVWLINAFHL